MKSPTELTTAFRARGLKVTPQRQCIFRILHGTTEHPTADAVYAAAHREMPTMSLRTVYQTLNDLAAMGELAQLRPDTGPTRFDPNTAAHHHLICTGCGQIHDLHAEFPEVTVPSSAPEGFVVNSTEVIFRGRCRACRREAQSVGAVGGPHHPSTSPHHQSTK